MPTVKRSKELLTDSPYPHTWVPVSTTWKPLSATVTAARSASGTVGPKARPIRSLARRNPRDPLLMTIKYRGGSEGWIEVKTRGTIVRVPGNTLAVELIHLLNNAH